MATINHVSLSASTPSVSFRDEGESIAEDTLFVAVSREVGDSKSALLWALENRGDSQIRIIHVHQPETPVPNELGMLPMAHRVTERERLSKKLAKHLQFCGKHGCKAAKIDYIEMQSVEDGIVKLISDNKIGKLVMGAASDKFYSKDMIEIRSEKAKHVRQHAPGYCQIRFVCKNLLIHTREATEMPMLIRIPSDTMHRSSLSEPSAPDLADEPNKVDSWLLAQQNQQPTLQFRVSSLERMLHSAVEQVENYKKERDGMQMERDNAIKQVEELRRQLMERSSSSEFPTFYSFQEIERGTNHFDPSLKIREDAYGSIYKGVFSFEVAVKVPHSSISSSSQVFKQEVEVMLKLRHPNIVNLISICPEPQALIYEYCANGSLDDQLHSLPWQTRIRIAFELCNVLMFLHSHKPHPIVHGGIRAENIHLDSNYTCKLNDFRASTAISYPNTDPEYFTTGELTAKSDVYSYGIILLQLLTRKPAVNLTRQVKSAVDASELGALLDPSARWPIEQAKRLAALALSCCEMSSSKRPDFEPDIRNVLESMKGLSVL